MKRFVAEVDRGQWPLLPECLDDFIDESNPVRVVDAFVAALDLAEWGFDGVEAAATGRPALSPFDTSETLHQRLSQSRAVEPTARARGGSQSRGDVAEGTQRMRPACHGDRSGYPCDPHLLRKVLTPDRSPRE
jgi:hypothetical protein